MEHFKWIPEACFGHVHRMADTESSTKEHLEDVLGMVSGHCNRDSNVASNYSPERIFFCAATNKRLNLTDRKFITPTTDELLAASRTGYTDKATKRDFIFGEKIPPSVGKTASVRIVKDLCAKGT
jgi:hypothetical protein